VTTPGIEAAVDVGLITGVIGAIGFGLRVGVCGGADAAGGNDATLGARSVCVGTVALIDVDSPTQAVINIKTIKTSVCFMPISISTKINWT